MGLGILDETARSAASDQPSFEGLQTNVNMDGLWIPSYDRLRHGWYESNNNPLLFDSLTGSKIVFFNKTATSYKSISLIDVGDKQ